MYSFCFEIFLHCATLHRTHGRQLARRKVLEKKEQHQRAERREEKGKAEAAGVQTDVAEGPAATRKVCLSVRLVCTCPDMNV